MVDNNDYIRQQRCGEQCTPGGTGSKSSESGVATAATADLDAPRSRAERALPNTQAAPRWARARCQRRACPRLRIKLRRSSARPRSLPPAPSLRACVPTPQCGSCPRYLAQAVHEQKAALARRPRGRAPLVRRRGRAPAVAGEDGARAAPARGQARAPAAPLRLARAAAGHARAPGERRVVRVRAPARGDVTRPHFGRPAQAVVGVPGHVGGGNDSGIPKRTEVDNVH
jgi:hypothetical protein